MDMEKKKIKWWLPLTVIVVLAVFALYEDPAWLSTEAEITPILVIDAGHGGMDGGAVASDGTKESGINLDIALRLEALARFWGVDMVMTRNQENIDYPADAGTIAAKKKADQYARVGLINNTPGAILLSIHQNNYPATAPNGIQVFYGKNPAGTEFATVLQTNLTTYLYPESRRLASPISDSIFLMNKINCPAVLVECGFLSNPGDLQKLKTESYRLELAMVMLASYLQYIRGANV